MCLSVNTKPGVVASPLDVSNEMGVFFPQIVYAHA
ncbi:unnamed protein product, partial [Tenebrio molitor]